MSLVLDLHIVHDRFGSSSDPNLNGHLHYPHDVDMSVIPSTSDRIHSEFIRLLFLQTHRETDRFVVSSGVLIV